MLARGTLSLSTHGAIELAAGLATMLGSLILGFGPAGIVIAFALGAVLVGMSLNLTAARGPILAAHRDLDSVFVLGAAAAALALAVAGDGAAGIFIAAVVAIQSSLHLVTRYTSAG